MSFGHCLTDERSPGGPADSASSHFISFIPLLFAPTKARWCDVQHVTKECMESSTSESRSASGILWNLSAGEYNEIVSPITCSKRRSGSSHRELRSLGVLHQWYSLHGHRGGGATDHWLQNRDLPQLRRTSRWTSERALERYVQEGTFLLHQNGLSREADGLRALGEFAPRSFAEQNYRKSNHHPVQPPRAAASSNKALHSNHSASRSVNFHLVTWHKNEGQARRRTQTHWDVSCRLTQTGGRAWSCW